MEESYGLQDYSDGKPTISIDPVCGAQVNEEHAPGGKTGYAGVTYYFCSSFCRKNFEVDPGKYIGQRTMP